MQAIDTQDKQFHDGNGTTELGTILPAWWLNQIQAEILAILTAAKVAPNKTQTNQLLTSINKLIAGTVVNNLTSSNADKPLSALQGKILAEQIAAAVSGSLNIRGTLVTQNLNDLYDVTNYGVWQNNANTNATTERNYPTLKAGTLFVLPSAYKGQQVYFSFDDKAIYIRDTRSNSTLPSWGEWFKISDDRVAKTGDTMTGLLSINTSSWQKLRFDTAGGFWLAEFDPKGAASRQMNFNFNDSTGERAFIRFPALGKGENQQVAYQSWVNSGFLPMSGGVLKGNLGLNRNDVHKATLGTGDADVFLFNQVSNKFLQLKDDGVLSYSGNVISVNSYLSTEDLNTIKTAGTYGQRLNVNATTARNYPITAAGTLLVLPSAYGIQQIYITFNQPTIYRRTSNNDAISSWGQWAILATAQSASITQSGIVQLSSAINDDSETQAATSKAVKTVYDLADSKWTAVEAAVNRRGIVQLSNNVDSISKNQAATPFAVKTAYDRALAAEATANLKANLSDFVLSKNETGYQKLPNGLILQWGKIEIGGDQYKAVTLPIAFPTACVSVNATPVQNSNVGGVLVLSAHVGNITETQFSIGVSENGAFAGQAYWFALGY